MVLLAKFLLLLFMIIVVHGNIVVDVEQKVNIDGCCNGCCPCNSCEPVEYKCICKDGIDGKCRQECRIDEFDMGNCVATNGEDCDYQCCVEDPCWGFPKYDLETCTIDICLPNGTIIEEKPYGDRTGCCLNPNTNKMVEPGTKIDVGGCVVEICINSTWLPDTENILERCPNCTAFNDPHFRDFSGGEFDWHIPCNHALSQEGSTYNPEFGVFMDFKNMGRYSAVGPATYEEQYGAIVVKMNPNAFNFGVTVNGWPNTITENRKRLESGGGKTNIWAWKKYISGLEYDRSAWCLMINGKDTKMLIQLCEPQITIWAPKWGSIIWPGWLNGYPRLGGLCSSNDLVNKLVARNGSVYNPPGRYKVCNNNFGYGWQRAMIHQPKWPLCPEPYPGGRKKRQAGDPQTVCSNITDSPYDKECSEIVENSTLTGPAAEMFHETCMFDLCIVVRFGDPAIITKKQMVEQIKLITAEVKNQQDMTVDVCMALGGVHVGGQKLYFGMDMKLSWEMAVIACEARGWQLASLDEPVVVYDYVEKHYKDVIFWVGGIRGEDSVTWEWVNGTSLNSQFPWASGEPNDAGGDEDCLAMYPPNPRYNDLPCHQHHFYICEIVMM